MFITIPEQSILSRLGTDYDPGIGMGWGCHLNDEDVVQLRGLSEIEALTSDPVQQARQLSSTDELELSDLYSGGSDAATPLLPIVITADSSIDPVREPIKKLSAEFAGVCVITDATSSKLIPDDAVAVHHRKNGELTTGTVDVIRTHSEVFERIDGLIDTEYLEEKSVTIVGLGTGGSRCAVELAKCGVGEFKLVDYDRLETHNITRHVCGIDDIGRLKTNAVADAIHEKNPLAEISTHTLDVVEQSEAFANVLEGTDLVVVGTDNELSKLTANELCLEASVPAIYGGAYERGFGGDVVRVVPGETACYDCVLGHLQEDLDYSGTSAAIDYSEEEDPTEVSAEPGLSTDVGFISLLQTKFALATLLRDTDSELADYEQNMIFWGTRPEWIFNAPFQSQFAETRVREDCETCQRKEYYQSEIGMTEEEAFEKVQDIVNNAEELDDDI